MMAKSTQPISKPTYLGLSTMPHQAWFSSVTAGNPGKADVVATSWQQVFTRSALEEKENRQKFHLI